MHLVYFSDRIESTNLIKMGVDVFNIEMNLDKDF